MRYCGACGQARHEGDHFCTACGGALRTDGGGPTASSPEPRRSGFDGFAVEPFPDVATTSDGLSEDGTWQRFYTERSVTIADPGGLEAAGGGVLTDDGMLLAEEAYPLLDGWPVVPVMAGPPARPSTSVTTERHWHNAKRRVIKAQLLVFRRCYSASMKQGVLIDTLEDLDSVTFPVPVKSWAVRMASRRTKSTGRLWRITKWVDR